MGLNRPKEVKARMQQKHDIEANWLKAVDFIPLAGEIIVYDADENFNQVRFKIGDGETNVNDLPFVQSSGSSPNLDQIVDAVIAKLPNGNEVSY